MTDKERLGRGNNYTARPQNLETNALFITTEEEFIYIYIGYKDLKVCLLISSAQTLLPELEHESNVLGPETQPQSPVRARSLAPNRQEMLPWQAT